MSCIIDVFCYYTTACPDVYVWLYKYIIPAESLHKYDIVKYYNVTVIAYCVLYRSCELVASQH